MVKNTLGLAVLMAISLLAGCSRTESADTSNSAPETREELPSDFSGLMDAYIATFENLNEKLEGLKDEKDAKSVGPALQTQLTRLQEIQTKFDTIPPVQSPEATEKSMALMAAMNKFNATVQKMMQNPAFAQSLQEAMQQAAGEQ